MSDIVVVKGLGLKRIVLQILFGIQAQSNFIILLLLWFGLDNHTHISNDQKMFHESKR